MGAHDLDGAIDGGVDGGLERAGHVGELGASAGRVLVLRGADELDLVRRRLERLLGGRVRRRTLGEERVEDPLESDLHVGYLLGVAGAASSTARVVIALVASKCRIEVPLYLDEAVCVDGGEEAQHAAAVGAFRAWEVLLVQDVGALREERREHNQGAREGLGRVVEPEAALGDVAGVLPEADRARLDAEKVGEEKSEEAVLLRDGLQVVDAAEIKRPRGALGLVELDDEEVGAGELLGRRNLERGRGERVVAPDKVARKRGLRLQQGRHRCVLGV